MLDEAGIDKLPEIVTDIRMSNPRYANQVGKDILQLADDDDCDHLEMGHHGTGRIGRARKRRQNRCTDDRSSSYNRSLSP